MRHEFGSVFGICEQIQPLVKGHQIGMRLQNDDQLLVDTGQALGLQASLIELPKQDSVSQQHGEDDKEKAEGQTGTDVEAMEVKAFLASSFRPSGKFRNHV